MQSLKRTYALPAETVTLFEREVAPRQRSAVVQQLLHEWLEQRRRAQLQQDILEGCRAMAAVYLETEQAWHSAAEEVHRALDPQP